MKRRFKFYNKYKHGIPAIIYLLIYLVWFAHLENTVTKHYEIIHMKPDNYIPFCEIFIIPYLLWFGYVAVTVIYLFLKDKYDFYKCCIFLFTGMTIFLLISTFMPNGHLLRPTVMPRDNIFTRMVQQLYRTDTSTNIWPSIHVYNSIGSHLAIINCKALKKHKVLTGASLILCILIILSTVMIKQHSVFDVFTAFIMAACMYIIVYHREYSIIPHAIHRKKKRTQPQTS